jgi:hypothetical protein
MPPAVGYFEASSAIESPTSRTRQLMTGHPIEMATAPPSFQACPKVVKQPLRMQMIVSEIAKLENPLQPRLSSCL